MIIIPTQYYTNKLVSQESTDRNCCINSCLWTAGPTSSKNGQRFLSSIFFS